MAPKFTLGNQYPIHLFIISAGKMLLTDDIYFECSVTLPLHQWCISIKTKDLRKMSS